MARPKKQVSELTETFADPEVALAANEIDSIIEERKIEIDVTPAKPQEEKPQPKPEEKVDKVPVIEEEKEFSISTEGVTHFQNVIRATDICKSLGFDECIETHRTTTEQKFIFRKFKK